MLLRLFFEKSALFGVDAGGLQFGRAILHSQRMSLFIQLIVDGLLTLKWRRLLDGIDRKGLHAPIAMDLAVERPAGALELQMDANQITTTIAVIITIQRCGLRAATRQRQSQQ